MSKKKRKTETHHEPCAGPCERSDFLNRLHKQREVRRSLMHKARRCIGRLVTHIGKDNLPADLQREAEMQIVALTQSLGALHQNESAAANELVLNKLECSRRQLETAIAIFFQDGDAVSIHTLTCAAYNVIRDVNKSHDGDPMFANQRYVKMSGKPSLSDFNEPENFFKHADRDADARSAFYPKFTECLLFDACDKYAELTGERVPDFFAFTIWFISQAPEQFDLPRGWETFADDAKEFHATNDRSGFYKRLSDQRSRITKS